VQHRCTALCSTVQPPACAVEQCGTQHPALCAAAGSTECSTAQHCAGRTVRKLWAHFAASRGLARVACCVAMARLCVAVWLWRATGEREREPKRKVTGTTGTRNRPPKDTPKDTQRHTQRPPTQTTRTPRPTTPTPPPATRRAYVVGTPSAARTWLSKPTTSP
jgi:hypothetical protein